MDLAEEAAQEALARAVTALAGGRLVDPVKLPAYVAAIARHVCAHVIRDRKPTLPLEGEAAVDPARHPQLQSRDDPLQALISADEIEKLRTALHALPADDQRLLRMSFHEDRSPAEIAASLGEPAERVRKRKSRALERLRLAFLGESSHDAKRVGTTGMATPLPKDLRIGTDHE